MNVSWLTIARLCLVNMAIGGLAALPVNLFNRLMTVELAWPEEEGGQVELARIICWEFIGLGGVEGNTRTEDEPPVEISEDEGAEEPAPPAS